MNPAPPPSSGYGQPTGTRLPPAITSSSLPPIPPDIQEFWQLPGSTPVTQTARAETTATGAAMTGKQKLAFIGLAIVLVIGAGTYWGFEYLHRYPGTEEVSKFVSGQLTTPGQTVVEVACKPADASTSGSRTFNISTPAGFSQIATRAGVIQMDFVATMESTEALYERVSTDQYIQQQGEDPAVFRKIQWILNGPNAAKLREFSGIAGPAEDFNGKTLVREKTPKGRRYTSSGVINALHRGGRWQMAIVSGPEPDKDRPVGYRLSFFNGEVLSLSQPDQAKKINDLINRASQTLQSLEQAQQQYQSDLLAAKQAAGQRHSPGAGSPGLSGANQGTSPVAPAGYNVNFVVIPRGTVLEVTTSETVDTSKLQGSYNAAAAADISLAGTAGVSRGSPAQFVVAKVGNAFQVRLRSLIVNGLCVPVNTEWIPIAQGGSAANQKLVIDAGTSYKFHQL
jgi:hypothetical protein